MVFYGDITDSRVYDAIFARKRRKTPIIVLNNDYSDVDDPMLNQAKAVAIHDMREELTYIHPDLIEKE